MLRPVDDAPACETCKRPKVACVCDRTVSYDTRLRVLILQHPQEKDAVLGSAQLLLASLPKAQLNIGLSWPNFPAALGEEGANAKRWAVLFPDKEATEEGAADADSAPRAAVDPKDLEGVVVLDGTWSKAKTLWWRNPWLLKLRRLSIKPTQPSIYGSLRQEPKREYVSTLESVAAALTLAGEPPEIEAGLKRVFRTLVQRVRDANIIPPPSRGSTKKARDRRKPRAPS